MGLTVLPRERALRSPFVDQALPELLGPQRVPALARAHEVGRLGAGEYGVGVVEHLHPVYGPVLAIAVDEELRRILRHREDVADEGNAACPRRGLESFRFERGHVRASQ